MTIMLVLRKSSEWCFLGSLSIKTKCSGRGIIPLSYSSHISCSFLCCQPGPCLDCEIAPSSQAGPDCHQCTRGRVWPHLEHSKHTLYTQTLSHCAIQQLYTLLIIFPFRWKAKVQCPLPHLVFFREILRLLISCLHIVVNVVSCQLS